MSQVEEGIRRTIAGYSQRLDDGRFEEWAELFTEDARLVLMGRVTTGREAIRRYIETVQPDGSRGMHVTTNSLIDVDGDRATATTDYLFVRPGEQGISVIAAGRYYDRLVHRGDQWQFEERSITLLGAPDGGNR
jgi:uncharacterized protein (TIGR02246 family)